MTERSARQILQDRDAEENWMGFRMWQVFKESLRHRNPGGLFIVLFASFLIFAYYVWQGLRVIVPVVFAIVLFILGGMALRNVFQNPPTLPPETVLIGFSMFALLAVSALIGYFADERGWMERENNDVF